MFSNLKNTEFNINALYTYTCIIKCEINLLQCSTACKMFETLKEEVSFSVQKYMCYFSYTWYICKRV